MLACSLGKNMRPKVEVREVGQRFPLGSQILPSARLTAVPSALAHRTPDENRDVIASAIVERVLQQILAHLLGRCHFAESLAYSLV